jgi:hypothetical protein
VEVVGEKGRDILLGLTANRGNSTASIANAVVVLAVGPPVSTARVRVGEDGVGQHAGEGQVWCS